MRQPGRIPRDLRVMAQRAREEGWEIERLGSGHLSWRSPAGASVTTSGSPSSRFERHKLRTRLRHAGLSC